MQEIMHNVVRATQTQIFFPDDIWLNIFAVIRLRFRLATYFSVDRNLAANPDRHPAMAGESTGHAHMTLLYNFANKDYRGVF